MNGARFLLDTNYVIGLVKQQEAVVKVVTDRAIETKAVPIVLSLGLSCLGFRASQRKK
jgi:hypothetical protein